MKLFEKLYKKHESENTQLITKKSEHSSWLSIFKTKSDQEKADFILNLFKNYEKITIDKISDWMTVLNQKIIKQQGMNSQWRRDLSSENITSFDKVELESISDKNIHVFFNLGSKKKTILFQNIIKSLSIINLQELIETNFLLDNQVDITFRFLMMKEILKLRPDLCQNLLKQLPFCSHLLELLINSEPNDIDQILNNKILEHPDKKFICNQLEAIKNSEWINGSFGRILLKLIENNCFAFLFTITTQFDKLEFFDFILQHLNKKQTLKNETNESASAILIGIINIYFYKNLANDTQIYYLFDKITYDFENIDIQVRTESLKYMIKMMNLKTPKRLENEFGHALGYPLLTMQNRNMVKSLNKFLNQPENKSIREKMDHFLVNYLETHETLKEIRGYFTEFITDSTIKLIDSSCKINKNINDIHSIYSQLQLQNNENFDLIDAKNENLLLPKL